MASPTPEPAPPSPAAAAWSPLRSPLFRALWIATVLSNVGTWLEQVGAAWLMTSLTRSAVMVALVQAATSLPMFLLSLPGGALADVLDRRRLLLVAQAWMAVTAAVLGLVTLAGGTTPWLLLTFTFLMGLGAALNQPAWQAITPELVPPRELAAAVALGSIAFNIARAAGPALGGLIVAAFGPPVTFLLNAVSFLGVIFVLYRWKRPAEESVLPGERFLGAMSTGLRYVRHAPEVGAVILRGSVFVLCGSSLWALLPIVAKRLGHGPAGYGLLLGALGLGAVAGAMALPHLKRGNSTDAVVVAATLVFAGATATLGFVRDFRLLALALLFAGGAWLTLLASLNVAIQTIVPSWVRARALSVYMLVFFAALTGGSYLWGAVADRFGLATSFAASAAGLLVGLAGTYRFHLRSGEGLDLAPSRLWPAPIVRLEPEPDRGPVLVTVRYRVPRERKGEFAEAMRRLRRIRLRDGAFQWGLFADAAEPDRYVELFLVKSWAEHLRQHERSTLADLGIEESARSFQDEGDRPTVRHWIGEPVERRR